MAKPKWSNHATVGALNPLAAAKDVKPFRDTHVKTRVVPCPVCKAGVGQPCVSEQTGRPRNHGHPRRRRLAYEKICEEGLDKSSNPVV